MYSSWGFQRRSAKCYSSPVGWLPPPMLRAPSSSCFFLSSCSSFTFPPLLHFQTFWIWGAQSEGAGDCRQRFVERPALQSFSPSRQAVLPRQSYPYVLRAFLCLRTSLTSCSTEDWEQALEPKTETQTISPAAEEALLKGKDYYRGKQKNRAESPLQMATAAHSPAKEGDPEAAELLLC